MKAIMNTECFTACLAWSTNGSWVLYLCHLFLTFMSPSSLKYSPVPISLPQRSPGMLDNVSFAVIKTKRYCPLTGSVFPRNVLKLISRVPSLVTKSQRDKHSFFPLNYFYWDLNQNCLLPGHSRSGHLNSWPFFSLKQDAILQPGGGKGSMENKWGDRP